MSAAAEICFGLRVNPLWQEKITHTLGFLTMSTCDFHDSIFIASIPDPDSDFQQDIENN